MRRYLSFFIAVIIMVPFFVTAKAEKKTELTVGDTVEFGSYPQTQVTDNTLIETLGDLEPEVEDYYDEMYYFDGNYIKRYDMMKYKDVTYNNEKYRGVYISFYRPWTSSADMGDKMYSNQDDNGYKNGMWYWFKYEPLKWVIFDAENGYALCENIIDAQPYNNTSDYIDGLYVSTSPQDGNALKYTNCYLGSYLRYWLEKDFTQTAFSDDEQNALSKFYLEPGEYDYDRYPAYNTSVSSGTHIGLLTYEQAYKETIEVSDGYYSASADVVKDLFMNDGTKVIPTDYARILGVSKDYPFWWLATGSGTGTEDVYTVNASAQEGRYITTTQSVICSTGVRPVICLADLLADSDNISVDKKDDTDDSTNGKKKFNPLIIVPFVAVGGVAAVGIVGATSAIIIIKRKFK